MGLKEKFHGSITHILYISMRIPVGLLQLCLDFLWTWSRHMWLRTPPPTLCPDHACIELQVLAVERLKSSIAFLLSSSYSKIIIKRLLETQTNPPFRKKKGKAKRATFLSWKDGYAAAEILNKLAFTYKKKYHTSPSLAKTKRIFHVLHKKCETIPPKS